MPAEKKNKKNRSAADKATDRAVMLFLTAAVVLGLILIGEAAWFFSHIGTERDHYVSSANSILHTINRGEYVTALDDVRYARACGVTEQDEPAYALPYAVADYYEAAFFCAVVTEAASCFPQYMHTITHRAPWFRADWISARAKPSS